MNCFQFLKLRPHKGLKGGVLSELGKINVICGPNNCGKTTILECISNGNLHAFGKILTSDVLAQMEQTATESINWSNAAYERFYPQVLTIVAGTQPVWFNDEDKTFSSLVASEWKKKFPNTTLSVRIDGPYQRNFQEVPSVILLPAKRKLETSKRSAFDDVNADGSGILNYLFNAKNQDDSSPLLRKFLEISSAFRDISGGHEFEVFLQAGNGNTHPPQSIVDLRFRRDGGSWFKADDCGLGLQEILIILYFALASEHDVVLIEEPENHLHPEIQRRLATFLREKTEKQFFLSTHSSVFLNTQYADRVFTCRMTDSLQIDNATSRAKALAELGYSIADNLVSDLIVLCEGPKDTLVLQEFFQKMGLLSRSNVKVWPLGGDAMDQHDLSVFQQSHKLIALVDNDPGSSVVRRRFVKKCEDLKIPVTRLERYSIENYFTIPAIASVIKNPIPPSIAVLDPKKKVAEQLGFEVKNMGGKIAKEMKLEDVDGTDFGIFLKQVEALIEKR